MQAFVETINEKIKGKCFSYFCIVPCRYSIGYAHGKIKTRDSSVLSLPIMNSISDVLADY